MRDDDACLYILRMVVVHLEALKGTLLLSWSAHNPLAYLEHELSSGCICAEAQLLWSFVTSLRSISAYRGWHCD